MLRCRRIAAALEAVLCICFIPSAVSAAPEPATVPTIAVTTREVQVPVSVLNADSTYSGGVLNLTANDFHVDVGGKEQHLSRVRLTTDSEWEVHDDYGIHGEGATSFGVWSTTDSRLPFWPGGYYYRVAFIPSGFKKNSCYKVHISVDLPGTKLAYPDEYCGSTSPANPLGGKKVGLRLQTELTSRRKGHITIDSSAGIFLSRTLTPTMQVTLEFPDSAYHLQDHWDYASAPIALFGMLSTPDEKHSRQFSDVPMWSDYWIVVPYFFESARGPNDSLILPGFKRYTRQFDLPAGDYLLKAVLDNGGEFGRVEMPIRIPGFDRTGLWIGTLFLCRRFHKPTQDELEKLPPQYAPLTSQGTEFEPAGDTLFTQQERLLLWFQIYAPPRSVSFSDSIHYEIKLVNLQTGKVESDTGPGSVSNFTEPGNPIIPIWKEVLISKLAPGAYRLDATATDSVTGTTVQSTNTFTMVKKK